MDKKYTKLKDLVDKDFTVEKVWGYKWKMWDNVAKSMLVSDTYVAQHRKVYDVDTDKGKMDISSTQFASMLEGVSSNGEANVVGRTFHVKSNGKTGMEIRYYINPVRDKQPKEWDGKEEEDNSIDIGDIPF